MSLETWRRQLKVKNKVKGYSHFDNPLNLDCERDFAYVSGTIKDIKNHVFLPFIKRTQKHIKYRKVGKQKNKFLKLRPIMYASHLDSHIYCYYNYILSEYYEKYLRENSLENNIIAYRSIKLSSGDGGKCNIHFAKEVFDAIMDKGDCFVITQDIKSYFDGLAHKILIDKIKKICDVNKIDQDLFKLLKSLTQFKYVLHDDFKKNKLKLKIKQNKKIPIFKILKNFLHKNKQAKGIPQGSPISGLLANIYLLDFDIALKKEFPDVFYRRYSDDLVFICSKSEVNSLLDFIKNRIDEHHLSIQKSKTFITEFVISGGQLICHNVVNGAGETQGRKYVDYLGFEFDGENICFRKGTFQRLIKKEYAKIYRLSRNTISTVIRKRHRLKKDKKEGLPLRKKIYSDYISKSVVVTQNAGMKKQVLKFKRKKNLNKKLKK